MFELLPVLTPSAAKTSQRSRPQHASNPRCPPVKVPGAGPAALRRKSEIQPQRATARSLTLAGGVPKSRVSCHCVWENLTLK